MPVRGSRTRPTPSFSLVTSVPTGTETANASTDSRTVADKVGHTSIAGPITGIKVDKLAPTLTIDSPQNGDTFEQGQTGVAATFACADAGSGMIGGVASCTVSINGGPPVTSPAPIDTSLGGPTTLLFTAKDAVGNTSTAPVTITVVDATPPFVHCDTPGTEWSATDVSVPCTASDTGGSGLVNPADAAFSLTTHVPADTETANAATDTRTVFDNAGNSAVAGPVSGIKVDKKRPSLTTSPADGATFAQGLSGVTAGFSCADGGSGMVGGSASCTVSIDGGPALTSPAPISTATLGPVNLVFTAIDAVGNTSTASATITIVDDAKPVVVCGTPSSAWSATDVSIPCTASDSGSGLANPADALFSLTTNVPAGTETANASTGSRTVFDIAGNSTTVGPITGIKVDKLAPKLTTSPTNGATFAQGQAGVAAVFSCTDLGSGMVGGSATCSVSINGGPALASPAPIDTSVLGPVTLVFTGVDAVGNTSTATATITIVDQTKPVVVCGTPSSAWSATDVPISCTASDSGSGLANPADALFSLTTNVPAGTETANASTGSRTVLDNAGNSTTVGPITGIKVDKKAPTLTVTSPSNGATINQGQAGVLTTFACVDAGSGMVGGLASCTVKINGGTAVATGAVIPTAVVGPVTLVYTAIDAVGNTSIATNTVNVVAVAAVYKVCLDYDPTKAVPRGTTLLDQARALRRGREEHLFRGAHVEGHERRRWCGTSGERDRGNEHRLALQARFDHALQLQPDDERLQRGLARPELHDRRCREREVRSTVQDEVGISKSGFPSSVAVIVCRTPRRANTSCASAPASDVGSV